MIIDVAATERKRPFGGFFVYIPHHHLTYREVAEAEGWITMRNFWRKFGLGMGLIFIILLAACQPDVDNQRLLVLEGEPGGDQPLRGDTSAFRFYFEE